MDLQLTGKVAVVTGASRGIGRAIAETLAAEGARVVLAARTAEALEQVAQACGSDALAVPGDLRDPLVPAALIGAAMERFGRIDILVNNAGATKRGDFLALADEDWRDGFALKFYGAMRCARAAWPRLVVSQGCIVNVVGVGGRTGDAEFAIGGAVNAALLNLTKVLADRGYQDGVRVNAVNPGAIATARLQGRIRMLAVEQGIDTTSAAVQMVRKLGVARFGEPAEIARVVAFLASPVSAYCHGSIVDADGGQTRTL